MTQLTLLTVVALGIGLALGLYISSQIMKHIDTRTQTKQFHKDLNNFDKRQKHD